MTPELIEQVFSAVNESPPHLRGTKLEELCRNDTNLINEVISLLSAAEQAAGFLSNSPADLARHKHTIYASAGQIIGCYRIVRPLGSGGMGSVYLAEPVSGPHQEYVAIKIVGHSFSTEAELQRFRIERQILANLKHPNIAGFLGSGEIDNSRAYLVMEYIQGIPINAHCQHNQLTVPEILALFCSVCDGVEYAHQQHIIHRDLKPANIMVTTRGEPKLFDFGIAKLLDTSHLKRQQPETLAGMLLMTPEYAAPEQMTAAPITAATDVYALGVILYELLAGERPYEFAGSGLLEIVKEISRSDIAPPSKKAPAERRAQLRGALDAIVKKALQKKPQHRYATVGQLSHDLRCYIAGLPLQAKPGWGYRLGKFIRHHAGCGGIAALAVIVTENTIGL